MIALPKKHAVWALTAAILLLSGCKHQRETKESSLAPSPARHTNASGPSSATPSQSAAQERPTGPIHFTDITKQAGIHFVHNNGAFGQKYLPETMGSGVCFIDYNNDGWQDILFVNSMDWPGHGKEKSYPALYRNNHNGTFTDVTKQAGLDVQMYGMGCAVGDYDNDGYDDIYITALGHNYLFHNQGNGTFKDVTKQAGVGSGGFSTSAAWFDYDNDGKLDLVVDHYVDWSIATDQRCSLDGVHKSYCTPELYKGESITLYHNLGHGRFKDVTKTAGLYDTTDKALGVALVDYDNDGWIDLFITNDTQPNKLYHNNHNGTFTETGFAAGVAFSDAGKARAGMGTDAADYDGSGRQSLVVGNFSDESMALYHNDGQGLFTDDAIPSGIGAPSFKPLTFATFFFDYDLDGRPDIFALNGHVADDISVTQPSLSYAEPPLLFRNIGHGKFENVSDQVGSAFRVPIVGRGAAYGDIDNDGDLDLVMTVSRGAARLLRNDGGNENDMLRVKTVGTRSNRDGIGARVYLTTSTGQHMDEMVKSGSSYLSQSELPLTFGLGKPDPDKRITLKILWPSGHKDTIKDIRPDQFITVEEGKGIIAAHPIQFVLKPAK
ncbi:MAG TPA: CRTAC1 family protein [Acidobacteriaceae bacterium]|nr:CRTAC1 family protein [Acidobacteriaceae bacterium]